MTGHFRSRSGSEPALLLPAREGYDAVAGRFGDWYWTDFWSANEKPLVERWLKTLPVGTGLDAGTGLGPYRPDIATLGHRCVGMDLSIRMLQAGNCQSRGTWCVQADVRFLPCRPHAFDWILSTRVLSNIRCAEDVFREFACVLKPGAECLITDVHAEHPYTEMSVPIDNRVVHIETYKHTKERIIKAASAHVGFAVLEYAEYRLQDLSSQPPQDRFRKLYTRPDLPLFYMIRLQRLPRR